MPALPDLGIFLKGLTADGTCSKCKERVVHAQPKVYTVWESLEPRLVTWLRTVAKIMEYNTVKKHNLQREFLEGFLDKSRGFS